MMATVLLAEDDADIRFLVTVKLTQAGYQVRAFGDGLSAVADAREHPPDLAILDVMMPGMSGLEVCQELRKDPATANIPVIILTALAQKADIAAGFAAGADDYIVKPFSPRDFAMRVTAVLARAQASVPPGSDFAQPSPASLTEGSAAPAPRRPPACLTPQRPGRPAATGNLCTPDPDGHAEDQHAGSGYGSAEAAGRGAEPGEPGSLMP
jgi:DNA-binding response OmpR family regulator